MKCPGVAGSQSWALVSKDAGQGDTSLGEGWLFPKAATGWQLGHMGPGETQMLSLSAHCFPECEQGDRRP